MKKIIYLLILSTAISAQSLDLKEQKLTPRKEAMPKQQGFVSNDIPSTIILDRNNSFLKWKGGLKFAVSNHSGTLKIKHGQILMMENKNFTGTLEKTRDLFCVFLHHHEEKKLPGGQEK